MLQPSEGSRWHWKNKHCPLLVVMLYMYYALHTTPLLLHFCYYVLPPARDDLHRHSTRFLSCEQADTRVYDGGGAPLLTSRDPRKKRKVYLYKPADWGRRQTRFTDGAVNTEYMLFG